MKRTIFAILTGIMIMAFAPLALHAWGGGEPPWNAPVMAGGTTIKTESTAIYIEYNLPYEKVYEFYKDALKKYPDEKYRDWKDQMYIEDQGGAQWHSIGISKEGGPNKTVVKITRDNMTWIFSTLLIRFAGVFFVLCILWVFLNLNSAVMKRFFPDTKGKAKA
jgi:hypothetical protein